jgi:hypothetical protein
MEFDIEWCHIAGVDNLVADSFSRLCHIEQENLCLLDKFEIPNSFNEIFQKCHNPIIGHSGVEKTLERVLKLKITFPFNLSKLREFIKRLIKQCPCCQLMSYIKIPIHTHPFTVGTYEPFERINMD